MFKKILLTLGGVLGVVILLTNSLILSYRASVFPASAIRPRPLGMVFGGGMKAPGVLNEMVEDRVATGAELYKAGKIAKVVVTGDDGANRVDEVTAMREELIALGVPARDVLTDPHGYRTYESCGRARVVYGVTSTVAISNDFHLARIIYLCSKFGVDAVGVSADKRSYGFDLVKMQGREVLARVKAFVQAEFTKPSLMSLEK